VKNVEKPVTPNKNSGGKVTPNVTPSKADLKAKSPAKVPSGSVSGKTTPKKIEATTENSIDLKALKQLNV
jgi:hypothetical protein